jgi:transposase-like protein
MSVSIGFKKRMVQRMLGPEGISASALSQEVGISQPTLSRWAREARSLGVMNETEKPKKPPRPPHQWTPTEKLQVVWEAASLAETELGGFLRAKGLHREHLEEWRGLVKKASLMALQGPSKKKAERSPEALENDELKKELHRKNKALAEFAAIIALKKKLQNYLEGEDTDTPTKNGP